MHFNMFRALESILSQAEKHQEKYDYLLVDSLLYGKAMNKIFKASAVISIQTLLQIYYTEDFIKQSEEGLVELIGSLNKKYNIDMKGLVILLLIQMQIFLN